MNAWRRVCELIFLSSPARRATRRTIRPAACRSIRAPFGAQEDRAVEALADGQIDRAGAARRERGGDDLPALAPHGQRAVPALDPQLVDLGAEGFGDAQRIPSSRRKDSSRWCRFESAGELV
jgi:hypothetical protein